MKLAPLWLAAAAPVSLTVTCAVALVAALFELYVTIIVQVPRGATVNPATQVPPVTVRLLPVGPAVVTPTVGAAVSVSGPGLAEVLLFVSVMVAL